MKTENVKRAFTVRGTTIPANELAHRIERDAREELSVVGKDRRPPNRERALHALGLHLRRDDFSSRVVSCQP